VKLEDKISRGFALVFLSTMGSRVASLLADLFLTRLLAAEVFGILGFGLVMVNSLALIRSMGVGEALIFRREVDQQSVDTALVLSVVLGIGIYGLLFFGASSLSHLLADGDPLQVAEVLRVLGLLVLLQALGSVPGALLERELAFDKKLYVDTLPAFLYAFIAVGLALSGYGLWSMVYGRLLSGLASAVASWLCVSWRPRWRWNWDRFRQLGGYGRYAAGAAVVSFLVVNVDDVLVGYLGGKAELGYYTRAYMLANLPVTAIAHVANRVAFPAYARLEGEGGDTAELYGRILGGVALLTLPMACLLLLLAEPFTVAVLGSRWLPIVPLLQALALYGFIRSLFSNSGPLFNAKGWPETVLKINIFQLGVLALILYPLIQRWGALGACIATLVGILLSAPLVMWYLHRVGAVGLRLQFLSLRPLWWPSMAMVTVLLASQYGLAAAGAWSKLGAGGVAGLLVYGGVLYWRERQALFQALSLVRGV
jgi:PST family polysaccharide transporter